jgi:DNA-binding Lrp family transcriptional regulator
MEDRDSPWRGIDAGQLHRIDDPAQAAIITDSSRSRFLAPFLGRERTVTQAAAELGCTPNAMLYRVRRMVDVGLLTVAGIKNRPGRPIKVYRSSHDGYFVPNEAMPYDDLRHRVASQGRSLIEHLTDAYTDVLFRSGNSGRVLARDDHGDYWTTDLPPSVNHKGQPAFITDIAVNLSPDEAAQIRDVLANAINRGLDHSRQSRNSNAAHPYMMFCAILPLPD